MNPRTLRVLEFPAICARLGARCASPLGREQALALRPASSLAEAERRQRETSEARLLADTAGGLPVSGIRDIREAVHRAAIGGVLSAEDLLEIRDTLAAARTLKGYLTARKAAVPALAALGAGLAVQAVLEDAIRRTIGDEGEILDGASPELGRIRRERRAGEVRLRERMEQLVRTPAIQRMLQEPLITIREERYVVPVRAEFREQFSGVAHDQSASGLTVFMEPLAVVPMGNRLRELAAEERREVARLLAALSAGVGAAAAELTGTLAALAALDVAAAKAALSQAMDAAPPRFNAEGRVDLRAARHPLLAGPVVPVDIRLGGAFRTLIITGPNTGGKTVTLRTLGLLTLMAQAGLHLPAAPAGELAVFPQVYADIGDEQSIQQNLSTFSSHLTAIVEILRSLAAAPPGEARALVLLDEVGAGTDPTEGAALAQALIETLHALGVCTAATTHYSELKALAFTHPGAENASVEFDENTLRPTFRLLIGTPGRSNAFVIAERLGLDPAVVERARRYIARRDADFAEVLAAIDRDRAALEQERAAMARAGADLAELRARAEGEARRLTAERQQQAGRAQAEVQALLRKARQDLDDLLAALRSRPTPETASQARAYLKELGRVAEAYAAETRTPPLGAPPEGLRAGEAVLIVSLDRRGVVKTPPDGRGEVEVQSGPLTVRVALSDLRRMGEAGTAGAAGTPAFPGAADSSASLGLAGSARGPAMPDRALTISTTLSLRGMPVDDAVLELDKYLDEATLAGLERVTIIHGKGTGALRRAVHEHLAHHPEVAGFRLGGDGEGGSGATIVDLARR